LGVGRRGGKLVKRADCHGTARHGMVRRDDRVDVDVDVDVDVGVRVKFEDARGKAGLCCAVLSWAGES
jgi:hypothetical protein